MSTLPGIQLKGERGKTKYQLRDINNLYRGESLEPHQQKSALPRKHGMQSLGKLPSARRPPANLPSLKSEHSGNDPAISLVPTGGTGWGSKPGETGPAPPAPPSNPVPVTTTSPQTCAAAAAAAAVVAGAAAAAATAVTTIATAAATTTTTVTTITTTTTTTVVATVTSVTNTTPPNVTSPAPRPAVPSQPTVHTDKSWSSIMAGNTENNMHPPSFLAHQSPQFQQEFPKLSSGDGQPTTAAKGPDTQYGPGPSLRPQTEGSWIQGGSRKSGLPSVQIPSGGVASGVLPAVAALGPLHISPQGLEDGMSRSNSGPCAALGGGSAPAGPGVSGGASAAGVGVVPFRPLIPPFLFRGNFTSGFRPNMQRPHFMLPTESRFMSPSTRSNSSIDDEVITRPIIKEEDFNKMDDIARDAGWATHDDIDYNQKLAFSDDEGTLDDDRKDGQLPNKEDKKCMEIDGETDRGRSDHRDKDDIDTLEHKVPGTGPRGVEDEEIWHERRRQHVADIALAVVRARQRKEEEEQRYQKTKQGAALRLQQLEEKMGRKGLDNKENKEKFDESHGHFSRADWEKEREKDNCRDRDRSRTSSEGRDTVHKGGDRTVHGDREKERERELRGERERDLRNERERDWDIRADRYNRTYRDRHDQPTFSSDFQHNLPPRFQKQQAERYNLSRAGGTLMSGHSQGGGSLLQVSSSPQNVNSLQSFDPRWNGSAGSFSFTGPVSGSGNVKPSHLAHRRVHDAETLMTDRDWEDHDRERDRERNRERERERDREREKERDREWEREHDIEADREHDREMERKQEQEREHERVCDRERERDNERDLEKEREWDRNRDRERERENKQDVVEMPPIKEQHALDVNERDRFRPRDLRPYSENGARKIGGSYFDNPTEYQRTYRGVSVEYEKGQPYERKYEQPEAPIQQRESNNTKGVRDKEMDVTSTDELREIDTKSEEVDRHQSSGSIFLEDESSSPTIKQTDEWHVSKDWNKSQESENIEQDTGRRRAGSCESHSSRDDGRDNKESTSLLHIADKELSEYQWVDDKDQLCVESKTDKMETHTEDRKEGVNYSLVPNTKEKLDASDLRNEQKRGPITQLFCSSSDQSSAPLEEIKQEVEEKQVTETEGCESKPTDTGDSWQKKPSEPSTIENEIVVPAAEKISELSNTWIDTLSVAEINMNSVPNTTTENQCECENIEKDAANSKDTSVEDQMKPKENQSLENEVSVKEAKKSEENSISIEIKNEKEISRRGHARADQPRGRHSSYAVYRGGGWGQQRDSRANRWSGPNRNAHLRDEWTESEEISGDEVLALAESGKEDAGRVVGAPPRRAEKDNRRAHRSPKQNTKKIDKEERNRDIRRPEGEKTTQPSDSRRFEKRTYENARNVREGFAPRGEPSRRGRGGFRFRGSLGKRMDGYGPPPSKSPFGQPSEETKIVIPDTIKENQKNMEPIINEINKDDLGGEIITNEDKIKQKQQTAGIIGSGVRHPANKMAGHVPPRMQRKSEGERKDSSRSKGGNGSRGGGHGQGRTSQRAFGGPSNPNMHPFDVSEECWETTSENSDMENREQNVGTRNGKYIYPHSSDSYNMSRRAKNFKGGSGGGGNISVRIPVPGKPIGYASDNIGGCAAQRGASSQDIRLQNHGTSNNPTVGIKSGMKEINSLHKIGENKVTNSTVVSQAVSESNSAKKKVEKDKTNALEKIDLNNFASVVIVDDQPEVTMEEGNFAFDADSGFQEVRSKKNVKEARQKGNMEELKAGGRPTREKEHRKSKLGAMQQQQTQAQGQQTTMHHSLSSGVAVTAIPTTQVHTAPHPITTHPEQQASLTQSVSTQQHLTNKAPQQQQIALNQHAQPHIQQQLPPHQMQQQQPSQPGVQQLRQQQQILALGTQSTSPTLSAPAKFTAERLRQSKLAPRFAKQRMKITGQQNSGGHVGAPDTSKVTQSRLFPTKDISNPAPAPPPPVNAWTKPINAALRPSSPAAGSVPNLQQLTVVLGSGSKIDHCALEVNEQQSASGTTSHRSTPSRENVQAKTTREVTDKTVLDGTSPPVQTIIFENTNYKTTPPDLAVKSKFANMKTSRLDKSRDRKIGDDVEDSPLTFSNKTGGALPENKTDAIQMPLSFNKTEDVVDMKLDFNFDQDLSQLTEDKANKVVGMPRSMHLSQQVQSTISPSTAELNLKIQSVKKVWENVPAMPPVIEHAEDGSVASAASSFTPGFGNSVDPALDPASFVKGVDGCNVTADESSALNTNEVYSTGAALQGNANNYGSGVPVSSVPALKNESPATSSNVCKVKPQQQPVMSAGPSPIGHSGPLSPPPFNSSTQQGHLNYQPTLGGTAQYGGISAIPSPPTVLYNSPGQGGLYAPFQIDGPQVMGGQARSQFSGFPPYGLSQGIGQTSAFNQQSLYLQTPAHPPPNAAPDIYQSSMSPFRLTAPQAPFGQSQQLSNNPNTVLISSTSNSLMSATVKPSSQQIGPIGAIGTKAGGPYQQNTIPSAPQPSQLFIQYDPNQVIGQNYLPNSQMVQRPGPVQSNVVPPIPPSSSFYSGSAGGQTGFYQPTNSNLPQAASAQQLHQTGSPYGLQGFSNQSGTPTPVGLQGFGSQMAQQYRNAGVPGQAFMKSSTQHQTEHTAATNGRVQPKSPSANQQDMLSSVSVFSSVPQIPSPKSRNIKQQQQQQAPPQPPSSAQHQHPVQQQQPLPPQHTPQHQQPPPAQTQQQQQQSPTQQQAHHKFGAYQGVSQTPGQLSFQQAARAPVNMGVRAGMPQATAPIYPPPIQRPVGYSQGVNVAGNSMMGGRPRQPLTQQLPPQHPLQQQLPHPLQHSQLAQQPQDLRQHIHQQQQEQQHRHKQHEQQRQQQPQLTQQDQQRQQQEQQQRPPEQQRPQMPSVIQQPSQAHARGQGQTYYTSHGMATENTDGQSPCESETKHKDSSNAGNNTNIKMKTNAVHNQTDQKLSADVRKEEKPSTSE